MIIQYISPNAERSLHTVLLSVLLVGCYVENPNLNDSSIAGSEVDICHYYAEEHNSVFQLNSDNNFKAGVGYCVMYLNEDEDEEEVLDSLRLQFIGLRPDYYCSTIGNLFINIDRAVEVGDTAMIYDCDQNEGEGVCACINSRDFDISLGGWCFCHSPELPSFLVFEEINHDEGRVSGYIQGTLCVDEDRAMEGVDLQDTVRIYSGDFDFVEQRE